MIPKTDVPRSTFKRPHRRLQTMETDYLVPIYFDETLPGDEFSLDLAHFCRMATPIFPIMDNIYIDFLAFSVPYRILWEHWKNMHGERKNPNDSVDYITPTVTSPTGGFAVGSLADYFGMPTGVAGLTVSALPFRAYNKIYNDWFRDENLIDSVPEVYTDSDNISNYTLLKSGKRHDYFTSCLPSPQKGPAVELPLGSKAPIFTNDGSVSSTDISSLYLYNNDGTRFTPGSSRNVVVSNDGSISINSATTSGSPFNAAKLSLYADLSSATAATINSLRQAFQLQKLYERDNRGGTRYIEMIRSHFGVVSPDARQQRPEFLGGFTSPVSIHTVPQTSSTDSVSPQGNLSAFGTSGGKRHMFRKSFTEYGCIMILARIRADLTYQQGLPRKYSRSTRFDYYYPVFSHLGEQAVLNKEIYAQGTAADDEVFGYQERYAEYRYFPNEICGKFRSSDPQSLDSWHLAQDFASLPQLNKEFIEESVPIDRVLAVPSEPSFICDFQFDEITSRPMPLYGTPELVDHF